MNSEMKFRLAINTSTIKTTPLLQKIHLTAKHGFQGVELWLNDIYEHIGRGGEVKDVELALADTGLTVPSVIAMRGWGEATELEYPIMLDEARRRMELAARLMAPFIVATPPRCSTDIGQIGKRYADLLKIGREAGVRPTFEYISFFGSVYSLEQAWQVVQAVNEPDATLILDAFHTWNSESRRETLESLPVERISHYHIDDADPNKPARAQTDQDRVMPGDGPIDLRGELQILAQKGYKGFVSLELFNRDWWQRDPNEVLRVGRERLEQLMA